MSSGSLPGVFLLPSGEEMAITLEKDSVEIETYDFCIEPIIDKPSRFWAKIGIGESVDYDDELVWSIKSTDRYLWVVDSIKKEKNRQIVSGFDALYHARRRQITPDTGYSYKEYSSQTALAIIQDVLGNASELTEGSGNATGGTYTTRFNRGTKLDEAVLRIAEIEGYYLWVDVEKKWYYKTSRGTDRSGSITLEAGNNLLSPGIIDNSPEVDMCNKATVLGAGSGNNQLVAEAEDYSYSAVVHERTFDAKDIYDQDTLDKFAETIVDKLHEPRVVLELRITSDVDWFDVGDTVALLDSTHGVDGDYVCVQKKITPREHICYFSNTPLSDTDAYKEIQASAMHFVATDQGAPTNWGFTQNAKCDSTVSFKRKFKIARYTVFTECKLQVDREAFTADSSSVTSSEEAATGFLYADNEYLSSEEAASFNALSIDNTWTDLHSWTPGGTALNREHWVYVSIKMDEQAADEDLALYVRAYNVTESEYYPASDGVTQEIRGTWDTELNAVTFLIPILGHSWYGDTVKIQAKTSSGTARDFRGRIEVFSGQGHRHTAGEHTHDIDHGMYQPGSESPVAIDYYVWKKGDSKPGTPDGSISSLAVDAESAEIDISEKITDTGYYYLELEPTGLCQLNVSLWFETFIRSEVT